MIPQHIYDAIIESPAGKLIDRLIAEDFEKNGFHRITDIQGSTPHGSIIDQLYETITTAQKKYRVVRLKQSNQQRLAKYQAIARSQGCEESSE